MKDGGFDEAFDAEMTGVAASCSRPMHPRGAARMEFVELSSGQICPLFLADPPHFQIAPVVTQKPVSLPGLSIAQRRDSGHA